jgi:bifunctional non-homologous end joining protein LigD
MTTTLSSKIVESANLYFKAGSSDKVYNATIEQIDDKYVVNFSYGRRGSALKSGSKTSRPVDLKEAKCVFDKLVNEKTGKGYQHLDGASAKQIHVAEVPDTPTESKCVLLNPIEQSEVEKFLNDNNWIAQKKVDGVRFMLQKTGAKLTAYNRRGVYANIPTEIWNEASKINCDFFIDGELVGDVFYTFDILEYEGKDLRNESFASRDTTLMNFVKSASSKFLIYTETHYSSQNKIDFYNRLISDKQEGIVFKHSEAKYYVGRAPSSNSGQYLKFKFYATCSCVVTENNNKRSVGIGLYNKKKLVSAGNVTIPINFEIPKEGSVVEVRYLYARKQSGSLYQPTYLGERSDISSEDCQQSQLKYKADDE